ncbi:ubiquinone biosynthesis protein COQ4 homolog, mitochondrial [Daphnia magna]|uniref:Ubiquinone biosynthesis protein COQ4 homolog, mitochondrial n=2 Tax=Daphnia magna TaxID=35525 RepID=A0A164U0N6_9CRUS|nr:ubiquinone biosynthesis protein COQ4 homolog, mitochondrial [Daphnia magna]KAK4023198.1 hypothetical protein OUZ56_008624 [Daphnia magna]KZS10948.1 Ubiquinone biosynthesis protein COQ4, mitochondrial [Daphnia magna]
MLTPSLITCHNRAILTVLQRHYTTTSQLPNILNWIRQGDHIKTKDEPLYDGHIPINILQRAILSVGSSIMALTDPARGDMIAVNGESSGHFALMGMHKKMLENEEGQEILKDRPRINSSSIDLEKLKCYPDGTLGREYTKFLEVNNVSPDTRLPVRFVDDADLAYVMQRYRETHDLVHTILGCPTNMLGEVAVKWVEALQTGLPMCIGGAVFGPVRLKPKNRSTYLNEYLPWAIRVGSNSTFLMNVYYERRWEQDIAELRDELKIETPPVILKSQRPVENVFVEAETNGLKMPQLDSTPIAM